MLLEAFIHHHTDSQRNTLIHQGHDLWYAGGEIGATISPFGNSVLLTRSSPWPFSTISFHLVVPVVLSFSRRTSIWLISLHAEALERRG